MCDVMKTLRHPDTIKVRCGAQLSRNRTLDPSVPPLYYFCSANAQDSGTRWQMSEAGCWMLDALAQEVFTFGVR